VFGEQRLVGRDHVLARGEGGEDDLPGRGGAADQFDDDGNVRVGPGGHRVGRDVRYGHGPGFGGIADDDAADLDRRAGPGRDAVRVVVKDLGDAAADRAAADEGHAEGVRHSNPQSGAERRAYFTNRGDVRSPRRVESGEPGQHDPDTGYPNGAFPQIGDSGLRVAAPVP
jgi:hypothetical protein